MCPSWFKNQLNVAWNNVKFHDFIYPTKYYVCQPPIVSFSSVASKALLQKSPLTLWMMLFPCLDLNSGHVRQATALEMRLKKYCKSHFSLQLLLVIIRVKIILTSTTHCYRVYSRDKKDTDPYNISPIEMRSLWMEIKYI